MAARIAQANRLLGRLGPGTAVSTYRFKHKDDKDRPSIMCVFLRPAKWGEEGTSIQTHISLSLEAATALAAQLRVHLARIAAP